MQRMLSVQTPWWHVYRQRAGYRSEFAELVAIAGSTGGSDDCQRQLVVDDNPEMISRQGDSSLPVVGICCQFRCVKASYLFD